MYHCHGCGREWGSPRWTGWLVVAACSVCAAGCSTADRPLPTAPEPSATTHRQSGIGINGHEFNSDGIEVQTFTAHYRGEEIPGPSPGGHFWTAEDADAAYNRVTNGDR